jgi:hypothetical protein
MELKQGIYGIGIQHLTHCWQNYFENYGDFVEK